MNDQNQELSQFVANVLKDMVCFSKLLTLILQQSRFTFMADSLISRIDEMGEKIDELERKYESVITFCTFRSVNDLVSPHEDLNRKRQVE